jgi:integrase
LSEISTCPCRGIDLKVRHVRSRPDLRHSFEQLFAERGLPLAIRSDNGVPFASPNALFNLSKLSVWWLRLGIAIERIKPGHHDRDGLYLRVQRSGSMSWLFRFMRARKERWMGLGRFPTFNLDEARERARLAQQQLADGIDPIDARREKRAVETPAKAVIASMTFRAAALGFYKMNERKWRNEKSRDQFLSSMEAYVFPVIGNLPVTDINTPLVLKCIQPHWETKTETMSRVRGRIERTLAWAMASGHRQPGDNPARWSGLLATVLPGRTEVAKVKHFAALPYAALPDFWTALSERTGPAAQALAFTILTAARTGETIGARWSEIDLEAKVWTIPAERMKAGKAHRVPLSAPAFAILKSLPREKDNPFVFNGTRIGEGLSNMAMATVLDRMKRDDITVHGFRSTFRDWAGELSGFGADVIEMSLAHSIGGKVQKAYLRADLLDRRRKLLDAWGRYVTTPLKSAQVVPIRRGV